MSKLPDEGRGRTLVKEVLCFVSTFPQQLQVISHGLLIGTHGAGRGMYSCKLWFKGNTSLFRDPVIVLSGSVCTRKEIEFF
jgi:hypothetical protein